MCPSGINDFPMTNITHIKVCVDLSCKVHISCFISKNELILLFLSAKVTLPYDGNLCLLGGIVSAGKIQKAFACTFRGSTKFAKLDAT